LAGSAAKAAVANKVAITVTIFFICGFLLKYESW
jgi:hypothetical protein